MGLGLGGRCGGRGQDREQAALPAARCKASTAAGEAVERPPGLTG